MAFLSTSSLEYTKPRSNAADSTPLNDPITKQTFYAKNYEKNAQLADHNSRRIIFRASTDPALPTAEHALAEMDCSGTGVT
jgi:hypothetical protein